MKLLKKLATVTLSAMLLTTTVCGFGMTKAAAQGTIPGSVIDEKTMNYFPEDVEGHWAEAKLNDFVYSDIIKGYASSDPDSGLPVVQVRPNNPITRAEFVAILVRAMNLTSTTPAKPFTDVPSNAWYYEPIRIASSLGIVSGLTETQFAPTRNIKRDEIATLIVRAFQNTVRFDQGTPKTFTDVRSNYWATPYINQASGVGIINGYTGGLFKPTANATRAEAVTMLYNSLRKETSAPPADATLNDVVVAWFDESMKTLSDQNYNGFTAISDKYATGYEKAMSSSITEGLPSDVKISVTTHSRTATVTQKSDRFATVSLTSDMTVSISQGTANMSNRDTANMIVNLKKMPDNTWKIYHSDLPMNQM